MLCPICRGNLEMRKVAPCYDCGHTPDELTDLANGIHDYHLLTIYGQEIVLCDFCEADFDSYDPDFLGLPEECANNYPSERISKLDDPRPSQDDYCPECDSRLAFLVFLKNVRDNNST